MPREVFCLPLSLRQGNLAANIVCVFFGENIKGFTNQLGNKITGLKARLFFLIARKRGK